MLPPEFAIGARVRYRHPEHESEIARHPRGENQLRIREPGDEESLFEERRIREPHPGER